jgi:hypothetical protein
MNHFTARPKFWQIVASAWASTRDGFMAMTLLFVSSMILGAVISAAVFASPNFINLMLASKKALPADMIWPAIGARFVRALIGAMIAAPVAVAMHRFILLDQVTRGPIWWGRRALVFTAWLAALQLVFALMAAAPLLMAADAPEGMLVFCARIAFSVLCVYLAMLFPAVATGAPTPSISMRLETSMAQTTGHFWLLAFGALLAILPLFVVGAVLGFPLAAVTKAAQTALVTAKPHPTVLVAAALLGAVNILFVAVMAAAVSWLYSWVSRDSSSGAASG